jgi:hypothetical protein
LDDGRLLGDELAALVCLVGSVAVRRLAYRRAYADLAAVCEGIEADLASGDGCPLRNACTDGRGNADTHIDEEVLHG